MTTEKMTVHKALTELKTMDDRIKNAIHGKTFVTSNKHSNTKINGVSIEKYCEEVKIAYQKATDLITRRDAIKRAVVLSNAVTKVVVAGREYTVAEAIDAKNNSVTYKRYLRDNLNIEYTSAVNAANRKNGSDLDTRADEYIKSLYGNVDMKNMSEEIKKVRDEFVIAQTIELVDPIKAVAEIEKLDNEINNFMVEVDAALSVSNALTEIEVVY